MVRMRSVGTYPSARGRCRNGFGVVQGVVARVPRLAAQPHDIAHTRIAAFALARQKRDERRIGLLAYAERLPLLPRRRSETELAGYARRAGHPDRRRAEQD